MSAALAVPEEAVSELWAWEPDGKLTADAVATVRAIAAPVVAAELRAQADRIATHSAGLAQMYARRLRVRADELEAK